MSLFFMFKAIALTGAGRYAEAVEWARRSIDERLAVASSRCIFIASCALSSNLACAQKALIELKRRRRDISLGWIEENFTASEALRERYVEGIRLAGLR